MPEMWKREDAGKAASGVYVHGMFSLDKVPIRLRPLVLTLDLCAHLGISPANNWCCLLHFA